MFSFILYVAGIYMQVHPDARSYRVKSVLSSHKLCIIYGQDKFDGSYSRLLDSVDPATGTSCMKIGTLSFQYKHSELFQAYGRGAIFL